MAYELATVIARVQQMLQDTGTLIWGTAGIGQRIDDGLVEIAGYKPYIVLGTATTTAGSKDVTLPAVTGFLGVDEVEFRIDKTPKRMRNFKIRGSTLTMDISFLPEASENVRMYCATSHILGGSGTTSLTPEMERILIELVAANCALSMSVDKINKANIGGAKSWADFQSWGERKLAKAQRDLRAITEPKIWKELPDVA